MSTLVRLLLPFCASLLILILCTLAVVTLVQDELCEELVAHVADGVRLGMPLQCEQPLSRRGTPSMSASRPRVRCFAAQARVQRSGLEHQINVWRAHVAHEPLAEPLDFVMSDDLDDPFGKVVHVRVTDGTATHDETVCEISLEMPKTGKQLECLLHVFAVVVKADKRMTFEEIRDALKVNEFDHGERQVRDALAALVKSEQFNTKDRRGYGRPHWH